MPRSIRLLHAAADEMLEMNFLPGSRLEMEAIHLIVYSDYL